jgi:hypothetical protein
MNFPLRVVGPVSFELDSRHTTAHGDSVSIAGSVSELRLTFSSRANASN